MTKKWFRTGGILLQLDLTKANDRQQKLDVVAHSQNASVESNDDNDQDWVSRKRTIERLRFNFCPRNNVIDLQIIL